MKIGICGGTFNPIHLGHTHIMSEFYEALHLDKLLVIPTKKPPHKNASQLASEVDRLNMCRLAVEDLSGNYEVSDIEIKRQGKSFTSLTIKELFNKYPSANFHFIVGEDMFYTLETWFEADYILKNVTICACPRSDDGLLKMEAYKKHLEDTFNASIVILNIRHFDVSSTQIRGSGDLELINMVGQKVADYITNNNLYETGGI